MKPIGVFLKTTILGGLFVLLPWAPAPFAGSLKVVPREMIAYMFAETST